MSACNPHFSFWGVAAVGLAWNLLGCLNYITQSNPDSVAQMPELYQVIISARPAWATAGFAIGVFGGAVGCILLLLRRSVAVPVCILSLGGIVLNTMFMLRVLGISAPIVLNLLIAGAVLWYATIARRSGWLS